MKPRAPGSVPPHPSLAMFLAAGFGLFAAFAGSMSLPPDRGLAANRAAAAGPVPPGEPDPVWRRARVHAAAARQEPDPSPLRAGGAAGEAGTGNPPIAGPVPKVEPMAKQANRPYRLLGRTYRPMTGLAPFRQRGAASWYGPGFQGRRTANGERYEMHAMTAAHPTLPLPSYVKVTNLKSGTSVVVRVNDRGPFSGDRIIDVSLAAARHLGIEQAGTAAVEVNLIVPQAAPALPGAVADSLD